MIDPDNVKSLYDVTGSVNDMNTVLVNRAELAELVENREAHFQALMSINQYLIEHDLLRIKRAGCVQDATNNVIHSIEVLRQKLANMEAILATLVPVAWRYKTADQLPGPTFTEHEGTALAHGIDGTVTPLYDMSRVLEEVPGMVLRLAQIANQFDDPEQNALPTDSPEDDYFMLVDALQHGFTHIDDDGHVYVCTSRQVVALMQACVGHGARVRQRLETVLKGKNPTIVPGEGHELDAWEHGFNAGVADTVALINKELL